MTQATPVAQLVPVVQRHETRTTVWKHAENPYIGIVARAYKANEVRKLNRADRNIVWVFILEEVGCRDRILGVLCESQPGLYRVASYGETLNPIYESLDFTWQAGVDTLYAYDEEKTTAKNRLTRLADRQFAIA
jgi:hypothetical protein